MDYIRVNVIRVYLTTQQNVDDIINDLDSKNIDSTSFLYSENSDNVMIIVEGSQANTLNEYMLHPMLLSDRIADLPPAIISSVTSELQNRGIITSGSVTAGDLLNNILKTFNPNHKGLGAMANKDFS